MVDVWERHGLTKEEYEIIIKNLGREPNEVELGLLGALWSEHCSYKSSKNVLKLFPTKGERVIQGPGENAGVIKLDDNVWIAFKIESHNHPSYIEPFHGAATGVGGIIRDILSMGARPIALMDSLRFGLPVDEETKRILKGVVSGISFYGNSIGVPTVGGETIFEECYRTNPLVNAFCLGIMPAGRMYRSRATREGQLLFLIGSSTGRDGIHGAVMASAEFGEDEEEKRSNVQIGDPFFGKKLIEAVLEAIEKNIPVGIQDLGAGGLGGASSELASKSGMGVEVYLDKVPLREEDMTPYEILLSESQERMLIVIEEEKVEEMVKIAEDHHLDYGIVGKVKGDGMFTAFFKGEKVADIPVDLIVNKAPVYDRPDKKPAYIEVIEREEFVEAEIDVEDAIKKLLSSPNIASKEIIFSQYDFQVGTNTVIKPGADATLLRIKWVEKPEISSEKGIAISSEGNGRFVYMDPYEGGKYVIAEACRNVACVGATPVAITDCLNFGNPERPEIMYQLKRAVEGMAEACKILGVPVVSGNVSLYNETVDDKEIRNIFPTPIVVCVGITEDTVNIVDHIFKKPAHIYLLGDLKKPLSLAGSEFQKLLFQKVGGKLPPIDLEKEKKLIETLVSLIRKGLVISAHDISTGGLIISLLEGIFPTDLGLDIEIYTDESLQAFLFSENPTRVIVSVEEEKAEEFKGIVEESGLEWMLIGKTVEGDDSIKIYLNDEWILTLKKGELKEIWENSLKILAGYT